MKIVTKYKDYYDYLSGIWGEDPKLVLDRRDFNYNIYTPSVGKIKLAVCGRLIEGYFDGKKFWYGEDLKQFDESNGRKSWCTPNYPHILIREYNRIFESDYYSTEIRDTNLNEKNNCPILKVGYTNGLGITDTTPYPILSELNLASFVPAEEIYQWLVTWLANKVDKSQERPDNLTNVQKIENKGFNKISSFRPNMKV